MRQLSPVGGQKESANQVVASSTETGRHPGLGPTTDRDTLSHWSLPVETLQSGAAGEAKASCTTTMLVSDAAPGADPSGASPEFEATYPRYEFAPLVRLAIALAERVSRWRNRRAAR
jgi:hypothetical protein